MCSLYPPGETYAEYKLPRDDAMEDSTMGYIELWLVKWDKYFIHPKQSTVGYTCIEKTDIKTQKLFYKAVHCSSGLKISDY